MANCGSRLHPSAMIKVKKLVIRGILKLASLNFILPERYCGVAYPPEIQTHTPTQQRRIAVWGEGGTRVGTINPSILAMVKWTVTELVRHSPFLCPM